MLLTRFKWLGVLVAFGLCASAAFAQSTTVSVTVTDLGGQVWKNGTISYVFQPNPSFGGTYQWNGAALPAQYLTPHTVTLNGSGAGTWTIPTSSLIAPAGSSWRYVVCPNASSSCTVINIASAGATQNISSLVTAATPAISLQAGPMPLAYADAEITTTPNQGGIYFNVTSFLPKYFDGTSWQFYGSGGGGGVTFINWSFRFFYIQWPWSFHALATTCTFSGGSGFANPMTTLGDLILGGAAGAPGRLGIGSNTFVLTSNGTTASWAAVIACATCVVTNPSSDQVIVQPTTSSFDVNRINNQMHPEGFTGANIGAKINTAFAACPVGAAGTNSSCQLVLKAGQNYSFSTQIQVPGGVQYPSLDCSGSTLTWTGTGDAIQVLSLNGATPSGDIRNCVIVKGTGNTLAVAAIHQFSRVQFTYINDTLTNFDNASSDGIWIDNVSETWGGYNERTAFHGITLDNDKKGIRFLGSNGGTNSLARQFMAGTICNAGSGQTCISIEGNGSSSTADMYDSYIDLRGNLAGTAFGLSTINGGDIRRSVGNIGMEGPNTTTGVFLVDANASSIIMDGVMSLEGPVATTNSTTDTLMIPNLNGAWNLQASPFLLGVLQANNSMFSWDIQNVRLGAPLANSTTARGAGYFQLYSRITVDPSDPEVSARLRLLVICRIIDFM